MTDKFLYLTEYTGQEISIRLSNIVEFVDWNSEENEDPEMKTKILLNYPREGSIVNASVLVAQEFDKVKQLIESGD